MFTQRRSQLDKGKSGRISLNFLMCCRQSPPFPRNAWESKRNPLAVNGAHEVKRKEKLQYIVRVLWPQKVPRKRFSLNMSYIWNIFTGTNTFEHAEFKSEKLPLRRPAVFSLNAILSSLKKLINNSRGKYKRNECLINVCKSDTDLSWFT
jgi:hypothetical protein